MIWLNLIISQKSEQLLDLAAELVAVFFSPSFIYLSFAVKAPQKQKL